VSIKLDVGRLPTCKLCGNTTVAFGEKIGRLDAHTYRFSRCKICNFISVTNPCLDFARLYNDSYYRGQGADPAVDYLFELEHPNQTIRRYEWRGIELLVEHFVSDMGGIRWLDYGCGNGSLVRYLRERNIDAVGFEEGAIAARAYAEGIPILTPAELEGEAGRCSVVTLIEVIEHVPDPMPVLRGIRRLLKPGGLLFLTTGNSASHLKHFMDWRYVAPDIHVSYFDHKNMQMALIASGFECIFPGYVRGWEDIIRFKILKTIGWRKVGGIEQMIPWSLISRFADRREGCSSYPIGLAA
jgi:SAM-dependent methyltransferase